MLHCMEVVLDFVVAVAVGAIGIVVVDTAMVVVKMVNAMGASIDVAPY